MSIRRIIVYNIYQPQIPGDYSQLPASNKEFFYYYFPGVITHIYQVPMDPSHSDTTESDTTDDSIPDLIRDDRFGEEVEMEMEAAAEEGAAAAGSGDDGSTPESLPELVFSDELSSIFFFVLLIFVIVHTAI